MKRLTFLFLLGVVILPVSSPAPAQTVPANPLVPGTGKRSVGGGSGGLEAGLSGKTRAKKTVVVEYQAVTPLRTWTNLEGKEIEARLLAWSVPAEGEAGPVEVVRDGQVRFLIPGQPKPVEYPRAQLEDDDQMEIERIVEAASRGTRPEEGEVTERESAETEEGR